MRRDIHVCLLLYPVDICWLFDEVTVGTPVTVVDQQAKAGWSGGELYLEVHPTQQDADALEETGEPRSTIAIEADDLVIKAAGLDAGRLDWYTIHLAETRRTGVPVRVTRPVPY